jgi:hypothetical protein
MRKQIEIKLIGLLIIITAGFILNSCENDSSLDFTKSWIEFYQYDNDIDSSGKLIKEDTIMASFTKSFIIRIKTQSNDGSEPTILKQIDKDEFVDITNIPGEANLESNYRDEKGYRQINKIYIELNEDVFSSGQVIRFKTQIGSIEGEITNELCVKIE